MILIYQISHEYQSNHDVRCHENQLVRDIHHIASGHRFIARVQDSILLENICTEDQYSKTLLKAETIVDEIAETDLEP